jgi:hypothetical protein
MVSFDRQYSREWDMREFRDQTRHLNKNEIRGWANEHLSLLGRGSEGHVYQLNQETVLKIPDDKQNAKIEYDAFSDTNHREVTPQTYGHHPEWYWMAVEYVEPFRGGEWDAVFEYLPAYQDMCRRRNKDPALAFRKVLSAIQFGTTPATRWALGVWRGLPPREYRWFEGIVGVYDDLDLVVRDVIPENLGIDSDNRLVLIDIYTRGV